MMRKWRAWFAGSGRRTDLDLPVDLTSPEFFANPAPIYAALRENAPVAPVAGGGFILSRHADIVAAMSDSRLGNAPSRFSVLAEKNRDKSVAAAVAANIPPFLDKPRHIEMRRAVSGAFHTTFRNAQDWIGTCAREAVETRHGKDVDLIAEVARPYVCRVMSRFVGLPDEADAIKAATNGFFHLFAPISDRAVFEQVNRQLVDARSFIARSLDANPQSASLLCALTEAGLCREEVVDNALLVLADGIENIEAAIALSFRHIFKHREDIPTGTPTDAIVDECLRLDTPGQIIPRVAREDLELEGVSISKGMPVFLALGSANLDDAAFSEPTAFRLDRPTRNVLTFGLGRHSCIGAPLGKLQIVAMIDALTAAGASPRNEKQIDFHHRFGHRWPRSFSIQF